MSHHFDTKLAKEDPSLNVCDFYLFQGAPGHTAMAMTVNPDLGLSAPDTLHIEGLYAFRFDLNSDAREEVTFKFRFGPPRHAANDDHAHIQNFQLRRATGPDALRGAEGELLLEGETNQIHSSSSVRAYVGIAPDLFASNGAGFHQYLTAFKEGRFDANAFLNPQNFFANRNATAIVLEVPNALIGTGKVHAWATISLFGHAPELQVSRWGLPMITHIFFSTDELKEKFNASTPSEDVALFSRSIADFAERMTTYAASAASPSDYGKQLAARLCPTTLPYDLGTPAAFNSSSFNGRPLTDDAMDAILSLTANQPLPDGVAPDPTRTLPDFPYYGAPYSKSEQLSVAPVPRPPKTKSQSPHE